MPDLASFTSEKSLVSVELSFNGQDFAYVSEVIPAKHIATITNTNPEVPDNKFELVKREPLKILFMLMGPVTDLGWNFQHNTGRLYVQNLFRGRIETRYVIVPE